MPAHQYFKKKKKDKKKQPFKKKLKKENSQKVFLKGMKLLASYCDWGAAHADL